MKFSFINFIKFFSILIPSCSDGGYPRQKITIFCSGGFSTPRKKQTVAAGFTPARIENKL